MQIFQELRFDKALLLTYQNHLLTCSTANTYMHSLGCAIYFSEKVKQVIARVSTS